MNEKFEKLREEIEGVKKEVRELAYRIRRHENYHKIRDVLEEGKEWEESPYLELTPTLTGIQGGTSESGRYLRWVP